MQLSNQTSDFALNVSRTLDGLSFATFAMATFEASEKKERGPTYNPELCNAATEWQQEQGRDSATAPKPESNVSGVALIKNFEII